MKLDFLGEPSTQCGRVQPRRDAEKHTLVDGSRNDCRSPDHEAVDKVERSVMVQTESWMLEVETPSSCWKAG